MDIFRQYIRKINMKKVFEKWNSISLVLRILCGLIIGIILGLAIPKATVIIIFGDLFVGALKAIAPLLVFFLVMSALAHMGEDQTHDTKWSKTDDPFNSGRDCVREIIQHFLC